MNELRSLFHSYDGCLGGAKCSCRPEDKVWMFLIQMLFWGVPALFMLFIAAMFIKAVVTGEPSL